MTDKELNRLAELLFEKIMERQDAFDTQYHEQVEAMMEKGFMQEHGLSQEEFFVGELARLQTILSIYEDKEEYEKAAIILKKIRKIAKKLGMGLEEYEEWEIAFNANVHQSLDSVYDEYSIWFASKESSPEEALSNSQVKNTLREALSCLPQKEALVIQLYYVEELNVYEIAEVLDITTGRVSQIKKSAISKLRDKIKESSI